MSISEVIYNGVALGAGAAACLFIIGITALIFIVIATFLNERDLL